MWSGQGCSRVRRWLWAVGNNRRRVTATASITTQADVEASIRRDGRVQLVDLVATVLPGCVKSGPKERVEGPDPVSTAREDPKVTRCGVLDMRTGCRLVKR